jgi:hypothetical protein
MSDTAVPVHPLVPGRSVIGCETTLLTTSFMLLPLVRFPNCDPKI